MTQELIKVLTQDLSCNPKDSVSRRFVQFCKQAEIWSQKADDEATHPSIRGAIQLAARDLFNVYTVNQKNGLHFDMEMIEQVSAQLEPTESEVKREFSDFALGITTHYHTMFHALGDLQVRDQSLLGAAKMIAGKMEGIEQGIEMWGRGVSVVSEMMEQLPLPQSIKVWVRDIEASTSSLVNLADQAGAIFSSLWAQGEALVGRADTLNHRMKTLRENLKLPEVVIQPGKIAEIQSEIKSLEGFLSRESTGIDRALQGTRVGFQALGMITSFCGNPELGNDIIAVGEAATGIISSIASVVTGSAAGGPLMPIFAVVGTVGNLVSYFFGKKSGPPPEAVILKQLGLLAKHLDERFDRIETAIQKGAEYLANHIDRRIMELGEHVDGRFDRIEAGLTYMCQEMLKGFSKLHQQAEQHFSSLHEQAEQHFRTLLTKLDGLNQSIDALHREVAQSITCLYEQDYKNIRDAALSPIARKSIKDKHHRKYYRKIVNWIRADSQTEVLSGNDDSREMVERVSMGGIAHYINKVKMKAIELTTGTAHPIMHPGRLVNPAVWGEGARTLLAYFAITPKLYALIREDEPSAKKELILQDIDTIMREGKRLQLFLEEIQQSEILFETLIKNYTDALREITREMYQVFLNTIYSLLEPDEYEAAQLFGVRSMGIERRLHTPHPLGIIDLRSSLIEIERTFHEFKKSKYHVAFPDTPLPDKLSTPLLDIVDLISTEKAAKGPSLDLPSFILVEKFFLLFHYHFIDPSPIPQVQYFSSTVDDSSARLNLVYNVQQLSILGASSVHYIIPPQQHFPAVWSCSMQQQQKQPPPPPIAKIKNLYGKLLAMQFDHLQQTVSELLIFIAFAFSKRFIADPSLISLLKALWNKNEIIEYIEAYLPTIDAAGNATHLPGLSGGSSSSVATFQEKPPKDFIGVALHKTLEPGGAIDQLKAYLLAQSRTAKMGRELGLSSEENVHPLVAEVLQELSGFRRTAELALSPLPAEASAAVQASSSSVAKLGVFSASASTASDTGETASPKPQ